MNGAGAKNPRGVACACHQRRMHERGVYRGARHEQFSAVSVFIGTLRPSVRRSSYFATLANGSVMNEDIAVSYTQTGHTKEEKGLNWQRQKP